MTLSGSSSVTGGSTNSYRLTISGGQQSDGGLDVSVTSGVLAAGGSDTHVSAGELIHSATKPADGSGSVVFDFSWTAPASPGSVTMYGAGNSVDQSVGLFGDNAAAATLSITVQAAGLSPHAYLPALLRNSVGW